MIPTKENTPFVPTTVNEIVEDVIKAINCGITMVHIHARDENGKPDYKKEIYAKIIAGIRNYSKDIIICASTSGRVFNDFEKRSQVLDLVGDLKPDMASLTLGSVNFNKITSVNEPEMIEKLAKKMLENNIKPELEIFDLGMVNYMHYLIKKNLLKPPYYVNLIVGNVSSLQLDLSHIGQVIRELPPDTYLSIGGVGNYQLGANSLAISQGYGVRVGIEDNYWFDRERILLAQNSMLLERVHQLINSNGYILMDAKTLRKNLDLI